MQGISYAVKGQWWQQRTFMSKTKRCRERQRMGGMEWSLIWREATTLLSQKAQWYLLSPSRCSALTSRACMRIDENPAAHATEMQAISYQACAVQQGLASWHRIGTR